MQYAALAPSVAKKPLSIRLTPGLIAGVYISVPVFNSAFAFQFTGIIAALCAVVGLAAAAATLFGRPSTPAAGRTLLLWSLLAALVVIGVFNSWDTTVAEPIALEFLVAVFAPFLIGLRLAADRAAVSQMLWVIWLTGVVLTLAGVGQMAALGQFERLKVFGLNPIMVAVHVLMVPLIGWAFLWHRPALRLPVVVLSMLAITVALATGSRGPVVTGCLAIAVVVLSRRPSVSTWPIIGGAVGTLIIMSQATSISDHIPEIAATRFASLGELAAGVGGEGGDVDSSIENRLLAYEWAIQLFRENPLFGSGTGGFAIAVKDSPNLGTFVYPHNFILQTAGEYGIVGLAVVGTIVVLAARSAVRWAADPVMGAVGLFFWAMAFEACVSFGLLGNRFMWAMIPILISLPPPRRPAWKMSAKVEASPTSVEGSSTGNLISRPLTHQ